MVPWLPSALLEAFPGFVAIATLDGTVVEANPRALDGRSDDGTPPEGLEISDLFRWRSSPELHARARDAIERAARGEHVWLDATVPTGRGPVECVVVFSPLVDANGEATHVAVFGPDVDPRNRPLGAGDDLYQSIFEHAADGIFVADRNGRYITANARGCELVGYTHEELTRLTLWDLSPVDAPPVLARMPPTLRDERWLRRKDGTHVLVELTGVKFPDGTMLGLVRDISARKQAEEALRQREQELEALSDATKEALFIHQDGVILATNKAARELYRLPPDGAVGRPVFDYIAPESIELIKQRIAATSAEPYEAFGLRSDGTTFPASVQARTATFRGRPARLSAIQDLSELRKLQASLAFADRMASIGTLAAGVAHEINNPLTFVTVGLEVVMRRLEPAQLDPGDKAKILEILRDAQEGAGRVAAIVRDLKAFSRADDETTGAVELAPVIHYAARMAAAEIKHRATLVVELGEQPRVTGNETRLGQVFLNLLLNAAHAIPMGKADQNAITVSARTERDRVVVSVSDTGEGIAPSLVNHIFEPFVTTKSHGTGLGLAICHGIVTRLGGTIGVESVLGKGTTFRVELLVDRASAPEGPTPPVAKPAAPLARRSRVLIVDDEPLLRKATARILEQEHDVVVAGSARQALSLLEQGERFDVVLCDLLMPEMTGIELFELVSVRWPDIAARVVFLTGGVFSRQAAAFLESSGRPWVDKPFEVDALLQIVREIVETTMDVSPSFASTTPRK